MSPHRSLSREYDVVPLSSGTVAPSNERRSDALRRMIRSGAEGILIERRAKVRLWPEEIFQPLVEKADRAIAEGIGEREAYWTLIEDLRRAFVQNHETPPEAILKELRKRPEFLKTAIAYATETTPNLFKLHSSGRALYDEIEFEILLLSGKCLDILSDLHQENTNGLNEVLICQHERIVEDKKDREIEVINGEVRRIDEKTVQERFITNVQLFIQTAELINKVIAINAINAVNRDTAYSLSKRLGGYITAVRDVLLGVHPNFPEADRLRFIGGKLLMNYSHLLYLDVSDPWELQEKTDTICQCISRGFEEQKAAKFGGDPDFEKTAFAVFRGNLAYRELLTIQRIQSGIPEARAPGALDAQSGWISVFRELYADHCEESVGNFSSDEAIIDHFVQLKEPSGFQIETIHHLVLFGIISLKALRNIVERLVSEWRGGNVYLEAQKIRLFSVIIRKLSESRQFEENIETAKKIRAYVMENEKDSGLVTSFSQLYLELAVFFSAAKSEDIQNIAMECFSRFALVTETERKFARLRAEFFERIGGERKYRAFEKNQTNERMLAISQKLITKFSEAALSLEEETIVEKGINEVVEELFYDLCHAEIRPCDSQGQCAVCELEKKCEPRFRRTDIYRGHLYVTIAISHEHYLLVQYPANLQHIFLRLFGRYSEFIKAGLSGLIAIEMRKRELSAANKKNHSMAFFHPITEIPNANQFALDIKNFEQTGKSVWSILFKIRDLDSIENTYETSIRDAFVLEMRKMINSVFTTGTLYHMGNGEFLLLQEQHSEKPFQYAGSGDFMDAVTNFVETVSRTQFSIRNPKSGKPMLIGRRILTSCFDSGNADVYANLKRALSHGITHGQNVTRFNPEESAHTEAAFQKAEEQGQKVSEAINQNRIVPHYQAIWDVWTGEVVKYECLARLLDENDAPMPTGAFIPYAEMNGNMPAITRTMFLKVCRDLSGSDTHFSINLGGQDLADPDLIEDLIKMLEAFSIAPERVTFEILEKAFQEHEITHVWKLNRLRDHGCKIAFDDFGWEASGPSRFQWLGIPDSVKIDGNFIRHATFDSTNRILTEQIHNMAKALGCKTIAEFVDSEEVLDIIRGMGIPYAQGHFWHAAQPFDSTIGKLPERVVIWGE